jgi:hypothetical protein
MIEEITEMNRNFPFLNLSTQCQRQDVLGVVRRRAGARRRALVVNISLNIGKNNVPSLLTCVRRNPRSITFNGLRKSILSRVTAA